jgi:NAD(P)-dependent dehydrogenase (short-subunit alcohol dehydrogenase family)
MLLENKYAVISGAATENGIGYATARRFAEHRARVAILDLERNSPRKKAAILGENTGTTIDVNGGMYIRA